MLQGDKAEILDRLKKSKEGRTRQEIEIELDRLRTELVCEESVPINEVKSKPWWPRRREYVQSSITTARRQAELLYMAIDHGEPVMEDTMKMLADDVLNILINVESLFAADDEQDEKEDAHAAQ